MFRLQTTAGIKYYQIEEFAATGLVEHCFSTRIGGISTGDYTSLNLGLHVGDEQERVVENRKRICQVLGSDAGELVAGEQVHSDQIRVVTFANNDGLVKQGDDLYQATPDVGNQFMATGTINQGYLESSNVNVVESMTNMIEATRHYEANQRVIKTYNKSLDKTVNSVGRL